MTTFTDRMVRWPEACHILGMSRSAIEALIERRLLLKPQPIGMRAVGWRLSYLMGWLDKRARATQVHPNLVGQRAARSRV